MIHSRYRIVRILADCILFIPMFSIACIGFICGSIAQAYNIGYDAAQRYWG